MCLIHNKTYFILYYYHRVCTCRLQKAHQDFLGKMVELQQKPATQNGKLK